MCRFSERENGRMATPEDPDERQVVCSACLQVVAEPLIHVIPAYNADVSRFVTTYRCEACWLPSLEETEARLKTTEDAAEIASVAEFFENHGVFVHEFRRGDPAPRVRNILVQMMDMLRSETIRLSIGPLAPPSETQLNKREIENNEKLAEAAYDAMYEARPYAVRDCFDDACGYLAEAISIAKKAGLDDEVTRLAARRDHIIKVYDRQFRGIG
jgi:hypothetical protein